MNPAVISSFQHEILAYYKQHGRHNLPWRQPEPDGTYDAYKITLSELMLQQTQVSRIIPKYLLFVQAFPAVQSLAAAPLSVVLTLWSGLGYNRRAKFLWQTARAVAEQYNGIFPGTKAELVSLPGVGPNTAGAILAYTYNEPAVFIETNVRTVFIHRFFADQPEVSDKALLPLVADTIPRNNARIWYWSLMDYGTYLKQTVGNMSRASTAYAKQSKFHGSRRQIRGQVLRFLTSGAHPGSALTKLVPDDRLTGVLDDLVREELIENNGGVYRLRML